MKQIVVIEPQSKSFELIESVLSSLSADYQIFHFPEEKSFYRAFHQASYLQTEKSLPEKGESEPAEKALDVGGIRLIIADKDSTKSIGTDLWGKILYLIQSKAGESGEAEANERPRLLLTAFEDGQRNLELSRFLKTSVFNVLIKPLDELILRQNLVLALSEKSAISTDELFSQEASARVELIKDINIEILTELGFRTKSSKAIPDGKIARYYGQPFAGPRGDSVFAYCYASQRDETLSGPFHCSFSFFGIPNDQLSAIRRKIKSSKEKTDLLFENSRGDADKAVEVLVLSKYEHRIKSLSSIVEEKFKNAKVFQISSFSTMLACMSQDGQVSGLPEKKAFFFGTANEIKLTFNGAMSKIVAAAEITADGERPLNSIGGEPAANFVGRDSFTEFLNPAEMTRYERLKIEKVIRGKTVFEFNRAESRVGHIEFLRIEETGGSFQERTVQVTARELSLNESRDFLRKKLRLPRDVDVVFFDESFCSLNSLSSLKRAVSSYREDGRSSDVKFFFVSDAPVTDYQMLDLRMGVNDCFNDPLDVFYLTRKLRMHVPALILANSKDGSRAGLPLAEEMRIKTAMPVTLQSISEVHVSIFYRRAIEIGGIRHFVLWIPNAKEMPEVLGICRHAEKLEDEKYRLDFLFFGMRDHELKYIRQWIQENYVKDKMEQLGSD